MQMDQYDVIIIGGGPAGYLAAERAAEAGLKAMLVEKREIGGVCLNEGCIPSKALLYSAKAFGYASVQGADPGVGCKSVLFDNGAAMDRKRQVVSTLVGGVKATLRKKGVKVVQATAALKRDDGQFAVVCGEETYAGRNVLIASGSEPVIPNIQGLGAAIEAGFAVTSREVLDLREVPRQMLVMGGGVIGLEMAVYYSAAGSQVTVVEMLDHIGGELDPDVSAALKNNLEKKGIRFFLSSRVSEVSDKEVTFLSGDKTEKISCDKLLLSVGRKPFGHIAGIDELGVVMKNGAIVADDHCRTNVRNIYAAGDVNGRYMLAHVAYREAEVAINNIAGREDLMDYSAVPGVVYTDPEVAFAGMTERQAKEQGIPYAVRKASVNMSGRHVAEHGLSDGFCKLLIHEKKGIVIGAAIISAYASEIIYAVTLMIQNKIPVESIKRTMFPHPTVCELIREAIFSE
ncbi:MAG TPA: dihydrolipoyl dehydrogenase [Anaerovoracaceae bacterium]|nr:dihydrolipoyl dehydrogenase [Anaerovoracaceae bacterium]